jgi:hypothetical protein
MSGQDAGMGRAGKVMHDESWTRARPVGTSTKNRGARVTSG